MPKRLNARSMSLTSQESYSAVMIADLVADVQEGHEHKGTVKQETNLGYDGDKVVPSSAVVNVDSTETVNLKGAKANGTDISKGVILNALQIRSGDTKLPEESGKNITSQTENEETKKTPTKTTLSFSEMSLTRKIAFITSFLPSILFVLCFAVILPCNELLPCSQDQWFVTYNDTEVTSELKLQQNLLFSFVNEDEAGVRGLTTKTGETLWETKLYSTSQFIECGNLLVPKTRSCLVADDNGTLHILDPINGNILWTERLNEIEIPYLPTIIPDCSEDGIDVIAVAVSKSKLVIFSQGNRISLNIPDCESLPSKLSVWKKDKETDIILICQKGESEILMKIPQNQWCNKNNTRIAAVSTHISTEIGVLSQSKLQSSNEGLLVWSGDTTRMFTVDGKQKWMVSNRNHSEENRFLFQGKFKDEGEQIILISSDISNSFQITRIDPKNGKVLKTITNSYTEVSEAVLLHGEKQDFFIAIKRKLEKSLKNEAVSQINEMSSTVASILAKEEIEINTLSTSPKILEELTLMDLNGKDIQTLNTNTVPHTAGGSHLSTFTVSEEKKGEKKILKVFILSKPLKNSLLKMSTTLNGIQVTNWDVSSSKVSQCVWK